MTPLCREVEEQLDKVEEIIFDILTDHSMTTGYDRLLSQLQDARMALTEARKIVCEYEL